MTAGKNSDSAHAARKTKVFRAGAVPYLNVQPLVWAFETGVVPAADGDGNPIDFAGVRPRELAGRLHSGEFSVAIVPVFEYLRHPGYTIIPGAAIATRRDVGSVLLFSDTPLDEVSAVHLDPASLTSVNLLKAIFAEQGRRVDWREESPHSGSDASPLPPGAAQLLIGDPALAATGHHRFAHDLGAMWFELTGLPFVFAAWLVHPGARDAKLNRAFLAAKEAGLRNLESVAAERAGRFGFSPAFALRYFRENLCYNLGREEASGWSEFARLCVKHGLCPETPPLAFHDR